MSILRTSWLPDGLYAPDAEGNITVTGPYSKRSRKGKMESYKGFTKEFPELVKSTASLTHYIQAMLKDAAAKMPKKASNKAPISIFVHGFQFDPTTQVFAEPHHSEGDNPHSRLYHWQQHLAALEIKHHSTSWPLGFGYQKDDQGANGLCVGFGWFSSPDFFGSLFRHGKNFYARAYDLADEAALHLIAVIEVLAEELKGHPINIICHSLGSRVVIRAIARMAKERNLDDPMEADVTPRRADLIARLDRVIILAGAEKVMEAQLMMSRLNRQGYADNAIPKVPDFYNFVSRENDVLDKLGENFSPDAPGSKQVVGHNGLEKVDPKWVDIQLDDHDTAAYFRAKGQIVDREGVKREMRLIGDREGVFAVGDHWIHYTWPDNMALYRQILRRENKAWDLAALKKVKWADIPGFFDSPKLLRQHTAD